MKSLLLIVTICFNIYAANIDKFANETGFQRDFKVAIEKAKKANKPLMMVLSADFCPWCRKFERKTLNSSLIKTILDRDIVTLVVDKKFDKDTFPDEFQTSMTPRVFFINPHSEKSFFQTAGYIKKSDFKKKIEDMQNIYKGI